MKTWKIVAAAVFSAVLLLAGCNGGGGGGGGITISGTITDGTNPVSGVTLTFSDGTTTTDSSGKYSYDVDKNTTTTVIPSKSGYTFTPASQTFANITVDQTQNFTATAGGAGNAILFGMVMNNHSDEDDRGIAGATVVLVPDEEVEEAESISPVEDLVNASNDYSTTTTDADGNYQFNQGDVAAGKYFIYVEPPTSSDTYWPGGSASRARITLDGTNAVEKDIELTDKNGSDATYIGSSTCLFCHPQKNHIEHTLHFVGIRKVGPNGTIQNGKMDMNDTSVYDLSANNEEALDKFTNPATQYTFANKPDKSFWLGKDATGLYFQLTSNTNTKFYVKYSYGGETGIWKMRFMTTVYASNGTYAANHGVNGSDYAYYVMSPIQYQEDEKSINGGKFVTYHDDRWDFDGTSNGGFTADPELKSFDLGCAACHGGIGIKTENGRRVAVFPEDENGYDFDGTPSEWNIGCEKCHGPGSNHLAQGGRGHAITFPEQLPAGRLVMICGTCHIRGENHTDIGGEPALIADGSGNYDIFKPGMSPADYFGTPDGTSAGIAPFGTDEIENLTLAAYLEPINYETKVGKSWIDKMYYDSTSPENQFENVFTNPDGSSITRTQVTGAFNHSRGHHQQFQDVVRTKMFKNDRQIVVCADCHDAHGSSHEHQLVNDADNNAACLSCHNGSMRSPASGDVDNPDTKEGKHTANFQYITQKMADDLADGNGEDPAIGKEVMRHVEKWANIQMGQFTKYDPDGATKMGRCTTCHMPKTAKSADQTYTLATSGGNNQYLKGDIHSHTFDVMSTEAINAMETDNGPAGTTPAGMTNICGYCHIFAGLN